MKAVTVTPYYHPKIGGLENYARQLNLSLRDLKKWEIIIITSNDRNRHTVIEEVDGMKIYRLGTWFKLSNTPINPVWPFMVHNILQREKPDLILAHAPVPSMANAAAIGSGHIPFVLIYHASTLLKNNAPVFNLIAKIYTFTEQLMFSRARRIVAVSDYVKNQFNQNVRTKTVVVPNSVWQKQIIRRTHFKTNSYIFIGSLDKTHSWKGLDVIIEALAYYKKNFDETIHLTVVGDGDYRDNYEAIVKQNDLTDVVDFVGSKSGEEKDTILRSSKALICYPTTSNDAFPTVILEAWAKGVPVIAAKIGSLPSLIESGVNGFLVKPNSPATLARFIKDFTAQDAKEIETVTLYAADQTRNNFTWEIQANVVDSMVREML